MAEALVVDTPENASAKADPRLIVPLDVPTVEEARALVAALGDAVSFYKVGLELFASDGMTLARELKAQGKQVFIDWKLHDIGTTVQRAAAALANSGCDFLTVHGEPQVMAAAVRGKGGSSLKVLAVTVLTSLTDADLKDMGYAETARVLSIPLGTVMSRLARAREKLREAMAGDNVVALDGSRIRRQK